MLEKKQEEPSINTSSSSNEVKGNLIANITDMNGDSSANIRGHSRVNVYEGGDVTLTAVLEAYPPTQRHHWITSSQLNNEGAIEFEKSFTANGYK